MRVLNPENGASIVGEAGDNIGRGNRTSIYFKDESAFYEHADAIDAALSQTSNCKIDVSTPNGAGNAFYRKRHGGRIKVFVFDWRQDPRKGKDWYAKQCEILDAVIVAQEIDRDYESSVTDSWIPSDIVIAAQARGPADVRPVGGLRVGVDVARFGDDKTVISFRRGRVLLKQVVKPPSSTSRKWPGG
jgi:phage terminase large subunit